MAQLPSCWPKLLLYGVDTEKGIVLNLYNLSQSIDYYTDSGTARIGYIQQADDKNLVWIEDLFSCHRNYLNLAINWTFIGLSYPKAVSMTYFYIDKTCIQACSMKNSNMKSCWSYEFYSPGQILHWFNIWWHGQALGTPRPKYCITNISVWIDKIYQAI